LHFGFEHLIDYVIETKTEIDTEMMWKKITETGTKSIMISHCRNYV